MRGHFLVALISLALILSPWPIIRSQTQVTRSVTFSAYNSYADIKGELDRISNYYSNFTALRTIGTTWEGRDIMALRVTDNPLLNEDEPDLLIMGGHHGNELPSVEVPLYILEFLVGNYSTNGTVRKLVDTRDIWFVPLVNPDGREYTLSGQGEWRKNRRPIDLDGDGIPEGTGVDLNRNYGHLWGQQGTSTNPNSHVLRTSALLRERDHRHKDPGYGAELRDFAFIPHIWSAGILPMEQRPGYFESQGRYS
jgi:murein tripeptide amidase MpaA